MLIKIEHDTGPFLFCATKLGYTPTADEVTAVIEAVAAIDAEGVLDDENSVLHRVVDEYRCILAQIVRCPSGHTRKRDALEERKAGQQAAIFAELRRHSSHGAVLADVFRRRLCCPFHRSGGSRVLSCGGDAAGAN